MNTVEVKGALRTGLGKPASKKLRREAKVPCVLYGVDAPVHFSTNIRSFKKLVYSPDAALVKIEIDGTAADAVLQDVQYHPVSGDIIHADFLKISMDKPVTINIPVTTSGSSPGVVGGGRLVVNARTIKIKALPAKLPDTVNVDISTMEINDNVTVGDLKLGEGVSAIDAAIAIVVAVKTTRVSRSADDAEEGAEGEAAEGEEGAEAAEAKA